MRSWSVTIPGWVPDSRLSLNGRRRTHPMAIAKLTLDTKDVASGFFLLGQPLPAPQIDPAHVAVLFTYPTRRRRDPDGLAGLAKPLLDLLVDVGVLVDDDCEHISLTVAAEVQRGQTRTQIDVTQRDPADAATSPGMAQ